MDFFEHQALARRRTGRLIFLFVLAVAGIVGMVYLLMTFLLALRTLDPRAHSLWQPRVLAATAAAVLVVIGAGSLWKLHQLRRGGAALAERVGGRRLDPASPDPLERRILNVVEEMAIASGTPVPPVYLLDQERGINAFAAGHDASDAVIGVTRGALEVLDRSELQGVVAHEFSHILNGDMRLNLELIAVVYGIEMIGGLGGGLLRGGRNARRGKGGGAVALGGALWAIGGIGSLFGRLIRAAVSKQREYLADASAVQFTRNPAGVAGALKKIGGFGFGSHLGHPARGELSHMFFGSGLPSWDLSDLFGTHPPLEQRIRRIDPSFDGSFRSVPLEGITSWDGEGSSTRSDDLAAAVAQFTASAFPPGRAPAGARRRPHVSAKLLRKGGSGPVLRRAPPRPLLDRLGQPGPEHLEQSRALLAVVPDSLLEAAHDAEGARALVCALLADRSSGIRDAQEPIVAEALGAEGLERTRVLRGALEHADPAARLALCGLLTGTLSEMDADRYDRFRALVGRLTAASPGTDLSAWIFTGLVLRQLDARFGRRRPSRPRYSRLSGLEMEISFVLSALAHAGTADPASARAAFARGAVELRLDPALMKSADACTARALEAALDTLVELHAAQKRRVLAACARAVAADGRVARGEAELFRVVATWLECPAPLLLPGQTLV